MNRNLLVMTILFFCGTHVFAIKENKIIRVGYLNYAKVIEKIDAKDLQSQIDSLKESYTKKIQNLSNEVSNLQEKISSSSDADDITPLVNQLEGKKLDLELLKIKESEDIEKTSSGIIAKINEKLKPIIQNIASRQNFDVIIDSSLVLIANPSLDITNFVLASL